MAESLEMRWYGLLFGVRRSIRYHMRRVRFFDGLDVTTSMLSVLFGSATILAILGNQDSKWALGAAALVTAFSTLNLVVGSTRRAREHNDLARRFSALERAMVRAETATEELWKQYTAQRLEIEENEPPILRNLDTLCHNELLRAEGQPRELLVPVRWYQRWFANVWDVGADQRA